MTTVMHSTSVGCDSLRDSVPTRQSCAPRHLSAPVAACYAIHADDPKIATNNKQTNNAYIVQQN
jgi:hypothetical protein